ncbi:hypothetical protein [Halomonas sp.]|uniref:hypothetical protein n=1 Tax=Halomonas sp. TaxID=1486246 RepID=UPI00257BD754|nr:hypothetical protein [Halomonas sp.]NQY72638.1 hypothetical protein [Halomonas sp.]
MHIMTLPIATVLFLAPTMGASDTLHFGIGIANYNNEQLHYSDKAFYENFSAELGAHTDFDDSFMLHLNAHLYTSPKDLLARITPIFYAGAGIMLLKGQEDYGFENKSNNTNERWGVRLPIGIELMTPIDISVFSEVVPSYVFSPDEDYESIFTSGIRYYVY